MDGNVNSNKYSNVFFELNFFELRHESLLSKPHPVLFYYNNILLHNKCSVT